jgi:hypothetical protein
MRSRISFRRGFRCAFPSGDFLTRTCQVCCAVCAEQGRQQWQAQSHLTRARAMPFRTVSSRVCCAQSRVHSATFWFPGRRIERKWGQTATLYGMHYAREQQQDQQAAPLSAQSQQQLHSAHRNEHGNTLEGTAPAGSQRHATINTRTTTTQIPPPHLAMTAPASASSVPTASNTVTAVKVS